MHNWFVFPDVNETSKQAADFIAGKIKSSIDEKGSCHVILPGGNTPAKCLSYLVKKNLNWDKVHWYLGDERCYPADHVERNDVMLENNLWSKMTATHIHKIPAEQGAEIAAKIYSDIVRPIDCFDIAFLGVGEDGHTASLFPGNEALLDTRSVVPVYHSPKAPPERVSLSIKTLAQAKCRLVLAAGEGKQEIIQRIKNDEVLPVNSIGIINWFVDKAAVSK